MERARVNQPPGSRTVVPLSNYTTWRVGGPAEWFADPVSEPELIGLATWAAQSGLACRCIGAGSNLLIADQGLPGLTICNRKLQGCRLDPRSGWVDVQAGEAIPALARKAARAGLSGLEWAVGIPGTAGGAVVMNAGAQGGCTAEWLHSVQVIDPCSSDEPFTLQADDLDFAYRHSRLQREPLLVLSARFRLRPGHDPKEVITRTSANLHSRTSTQPYQQPSCGSVFRNPDPLKAGRLIEGLGLKGLTIGGAQISPIHANFIVNTGAAQAWEIKHLIELVQDKVRAAHGIELHPEVMRLGF